MSLARIWIAPRSISWLLAALVLLSAALTGCGTPADAASRPELSDYPWIYLRDGQAFAPGEAEASIASVVLVGDVMLGRGGAGEPDPFGLAAPWLQAADLTLGNLEAAIAPEGEDLASEPSQVSNSGPYRLIAPAPAAGLLSRAGFDLLGMANNHALDRGLAGLSDTAAALQRAGLQPLGAGLTPDLAFEPVIRTIGGTKIAFLAFNAVPSPRGPQWSGEVRQAEPQPGWALAGWEPERALAAVRTADAAADAVIVSIHWGYEYDLRVDPAQRVIAEALAAAGADLIVGHHPHVVQPVATLTKPGGEGQAWVAYSLGNFVFDQGFEETGQGLALRAFFDRRGLLAVQALPVHARLRPSLMKPEAASKLLERIQPEMHEAAWTCVQDYCTPVEDNAGQGHELKSQSAADLDADGLPESIRLEAGRVTIEGNGAFRWESLPEWQVIDLAAGDPNGDGRQELLLAIQKPDRSGIPLSHPFLLGYREGQMRLLWGGSAVSDPILEVELGDVDGDGGQELVVLEALHGGPQRAVSVWRWNGWGFSQVWRSTPGSYSRLRLAEVPGIQGLQIVAEQPVE